MILRRHPIYIIFPALDIIAEPEMIGTLFSWLESVDDSMSEESGPTTAKVESIAMAIGEEGGEEEQEEKEDETTSSGTKSMPPPPQPSLPSLPTDESEEVLHRFEHGNVSDFKFAFGLWCLEVRVTVKHYHSLLQVLSLVQDLMELRTLPHSLTTMKEKTRCHLPLMKMRKKKVPLQLTKLATQQAKHKSDAADPRLSTYVLNRYLLYSRTVQLYSNHLSHKN